MIAQDEKNHQARQLTLKRISFVSGGAQAYSGLGMCVSSLGTACAGVGVPMMMQGANNVYENGYYLLFREERSGAVRDAYRLLAQKIGYSNDAADAAYNAVDIALSGYTTGRKIWHPRHKSWRLFYHTPRDYIYGWRQMGMVAFGTDIVSNSLTSYTIYNILTGSEENGK